MTVSATTAVIVHAGDGTTTSFTFPFKILTENDLYVQRMAADGTVTTLGLGTGYTVASGVGSDSGGTITCPVSGSPLASGEQLSITRDMVLDQDLDLRDTGGYDKELIETGLDKLTMAVQTIDERLGRCLSFSAFAAAETPELDVDTIVGSVNSARDEAEAAASAASAAASTATTAAADAIDDHESEFDHSILASTAMHSSLGGLDADDHLHYLTQTRGNLLYQAKGEHLAGCRLVYTSATSVTLARVGSGVVAMPDASTVTVPSGGIALAKTGLSSSTLYYVYLTTAGALEASTTGTATTNGFRHKTGDTTRLLVGLVRTNSSSEFQSDAAARLVLSYFNRRAVSGVTSFSAIRSTTSNTVAGVVLSQSWELVNFLSWEGIICAGCAGNAANSTHLDSVWVALGLDGAIASPFFGIFPDVTNKYYGFCVPMVPLTVTEGYHSVSIVGRVSNTGTLLVLGNDANNGAKTYLHLEG